MSESPSPVAPEALSAFCAEVLHAHDVPPEDADLVSDSLVQAELWGHESHGVLRLPWYVARLRSGAMRAVTEPVIVSDSGAVQVIDGQDGIGQVLAAHACDLAAERAAAHGISGVAVRNSNHFGTAAYFTRRMVERGCVGMLFTNSSPAMAPWGGAAKVIGSNPWSIAAPAGRYGIAVLDIANSAVARGKIYAAARHGEQIPPSWATTAEGAPTTDPQEAIDGIALPMAGHKGYVISFMLDVLSGVLTGSSFGSSVVGPYRPEGHSGAGHLAIALHIDSFLGGPDFNSRMEDLVAQVKSVRLAPGFTQILIPGEWEQQNLRRSNETGIVLPVATLDALAKLAIDTGVACLPR
jgi:LDH2 family malate/lactate/ureidoglycolate dehydrogenase